MKAILLTTALSGVLLLAACGESDPTSGDPLTAEVSGDNIGKTCRAMHDGRERARIERYKARGELNAATSAEIKALFDHARDECCAKLQEAANAQSQSVMRVMFWDLMRDNTMSEIPAESRKATETYRLVIDNTPESDTSIADRLYSEQQECAGKASY
ncbi:MAG: hypothetical protein HXY22_11810 [Alphaproteobacteria bacterium]|nr:hypothetical protein [Alphaproteobacteria bacterium]